MTFQELSDHIKAEHRPNYAKLLMAHTDVIMMNIAKTTKRETAIALNIQPSAFSLVYALLLEHKELTNEAN